MHVLMPYVGALNRTIQSVLTSISLGCVEAETVKVGVLVHALGLSS